MSNGLAAVSIACRRGELLDQVVDPAARRLVGVGRGDARLVQPGHRHHHDGLGDVVEHDHLVVEGEGQIGHLAVVGRGVGQVLEVADRVVAGVSDRTATEGGQLRQMDRPDRLDLPPKLVQRVVAIELAGDQRRRPARRNPRIGIGRHPAAVGLDLEERLGGQETVASHFLAADDALEQASAASGVDLVEGADRSERIAHQPPVDGHQLGAGGQTLEGLEVGVVRGCRSVS